MEGEGGGEGGQTDRQRVRERERCFLRFRGFINLPPLRRLHPNLSTSLTKLRHGCVHSLLQAGCRRLARVLLQSFISRCDTPLQVTAGAISVAQAAARCFGPGPWHSAGLQFAHLAAQLSYAPRMLNLPTESLQPYSP